MPDQRLDSWKEIGAFFDRDERTVKRWEKDRGLPVHRFPGTKGRVFAYPDELTEWLKATGVGPSAPVAVGTADGGAAENTAPVLAVQPPAPAGIHRRLATIAACGLAVCLLALTGYRFFPGRVMAAKPRRANAEAEALYLKGRFYWNERTPDSLNQALDYFGKAVARDPGYAEAYVGLADTYNLIREYTPMPQSEAFPKAVAAARRALELDESQAGAHRALAFALFWGYFDRAGAEREFKRSIELDPNSAVTHHWYATYLAMLGRSTDALDQIAIAQKLDPASRAIVSDQAWILWTAGRSQEATAELQPLTVSDPGFVSPHRYLSYIYLSEKEYAAYLRELEQTGALSHDSQTVAEAQAAGDALARGGATQMLDELLRWQKKRLAQGTGTLLEVAAAYARLGRKTDAIAYLSAAKRRSPTELLGLRTEPAFRTLEDEPAYQELVRDVGSW